MVHAEFPFPARAEDDPPAREFRQAGKSELDHGLPDGQLRGVDAPAEGFDAAAKSGRTDELHAQLVELAKSQQRCSGNKDKVGVFEEAVEEDSEFSHDGGEGDLGGFAPVAEPLVEGL
ncbi:MAG: hypothetical protein JNK23_21605, partial [Opitutaceae bacterium]|nr:hypothetical protein [Opitutaceae bacterium]